MKRWKDNINEWTGCVVGCFGFNGPLRQYCSLYRAVSQREGDRSENELENVFMKHYAPNHMLAPQKRFKSERSATQTIKKLISSSTP